jgi:hypothetical protein
MLTLEIEKFPSVVIEDAEFQLHGEELPSNCDTDLYDEPDTDE